MAKKKAEMEDDRGNYTALVSKARTAEREGMFYDAVRFAVASWDYIDGMMQYEGKYGDREFANVQGIEVVLRYAPLLLDYKSLDELESLLKKCPRIDRVATDDIAQQLGDARRLMWDAHRLCDHLERNCDCRQDTLRQELGGDQDRWRAITEVWESAGFVYRVPEGGSYRVRFCTRMGDVIPGKCPLCGALRELPERSMLNEIACPACGESVALVILGCDPKNRVRKEGE